MKRLLLLAALASAANAQFAIDNIVLPEAILGLPYPAVEITTSNGVGPVQWTFIHAPSPPGGFVIGPSAAGQNVTSASFCYGVLEVSGRPICGGNVLGFPGGYLINVRAQDAEGHVATRVFTLQLVQTLVIVTSALPEAVIGAPYSITLQGAGGTGNYSWSIASGDLPAGLFLNSATGVISGTAPNTAGTSAFVVRMTDNQTAASVLRQFTLTVVGGLRITTTALPLVVAGQPMQPFQLTAAGGDNLVWSVTPGYELPGSFDLSPSGILSGGSSTSGSHRFSIRVFDNDSGLTDDRIFDLYVTLGMLRIVENSLPVAAVNFPYQTTLTPAGGLPPYQWGFGTLANQGLSIHPQTGTITGSPPQLGTFQIPINLTDATGTRFTHVFTLQVVNTITITTSSFPNGTVGTPFFSTLGATGGQAPYRWTVLQGVLPPGLALDNVQGTIAGTPTQEGAFAFTLRVSDFGGRSATRQLGIVVGQGISIVTSALADGVVGESYGVALHSTGGLAPVTWSIVSGSLPAGLTLNSSTGVISGSPIAVFSGSITFRAADSAGNSAERTLTLTIVARLLITTSALNGGSPNIAYSATLTAAGGRAPYTWSIVSGALPPGLQLTTATGVIGGTPTAAGAFSFGVRLNDGSGQTAIANFTLNIGDPLSIITGAINATAGQALSQALAATGGTAPYTFSVVSGTLPAGVTFNAASATISGTPTQAGTFSVTFQVRDQQQQTATRAIAITVGLPPLPNVTIDGFDGVSSGGQSTVSLRLGSPYPVEVTGMLVLQFLGNAIGGGGDDTVRFANGSREIGFAIPAGATQAVFSPGPNAVILTGTTTGAIALTAQISEPSPSVPIPRTANVAARAPVISSLTTQRSGNTITVVVTGYTNTHEISSGVFRFAAGSGSSLQQSEFTVQLGTAFTAWFGNPASQATGGQFRLTVPFTISGDAGAVSLTGVTLTNSVGGTNANPQ